MQTCQNSAKAMCLAGGKRAGERGEGKAGWMASHARRWKPAGLQQPEHAFRPERPIQKPRLWNDLLCMPRPNPQGASTLDRPSLLPLTPGAMRTPKPRSPAPSPSCSSSSTSPCPKTSPSPLRTQDGRRSNRAAGCRWAPASRPSAWCSRPRMIFSCSATPCRTTSWGGATTTCARECRRVPDQHVANIDQTWLTLANFGQSCRPTFGEHRPISVKTRQMGSTLAIVGQQSAHIGQF